MNQSGKARNHVTQGRGHIVLSKRGKENRSSTQQGIHICLKQAGIAETMSG